MDVGTFTAFTAAILGAGGIGALAAFRKAGAEADGLAAQTLIAVNTELRRELTRRDEEITRLRERVAVLENRMGRDPPPG